MQKIRTQRKRETFEQRFWARVDNSGGPKACWPWTGNFDKSGYGMVRRDGKYCSTQKVAHELTSGVTIAHGLKACHHCDNPPCCNPIHVYAGTHTQNMRDIHLPPHLTIEDRIRLRSEESNGD
jgi:hypothetical protein